MNANFAQPFSILHVEDDEIDTVLVKRAFRRSDITNPLYNVCDGVEALEVLNGENPDIKISQPCVMLVDLNMPRMNGIQLLQKLRNDQNFRKNVVFVLTTSNDDQDKIQSYNLSIAGYILKENLDELTEMLKNYCKINEFPSTQFFDKTSSIN